MRRMPNSAGIFAVLGTPFSCGPEALPKRNFVIRAMHLPRRRTGGVITGLRRVLPLTLAVGLGALTMPQAASAQQFVDLTCIGAGSGSAVPGVTLTPAPQHITAVLKVGSALSPATPCTSLTGIPYAGVTFEMEGSGVLGCLSGSLAGTAKLTWDNGDTANAGWSLNLPLFVLPIYEFHITDGPLAGTRVTGIGVPTGFAGNCVTHPLVRLGGAGIGLMFRF